MSESAEHHTIVGLLTQRGLTTAAELMAATRKSQPTVSRLLADLAPRIVRFGRGRATRYGLPKSIHGLSPQHTVWWTDEQGRREGVGTLTLLANDSVVVASQLLGRHVGPSLPWFLAPLRAEGFLGRLAARLRGTSGRPPAEAI